jgi:putative methyltransferase (TIGR04325 family)
MSTASAVALRYMPAGHSCPAAIQEHLALGKKARPSDYPVLFHLGGLIKDKLAVFDLGGSSGNLWYCYSQYLNIHPDMQWIVFDLPETVEFGRRLAQDRGVHGLSFTTDLQALGGADILLSSGSLHYFEFSLPDILATMAHKPRHIIINRTPLTDGVSAVTVQDGDSHLVACRTNRRADLIHDLKALKYALVDSWSVPELSLQVPFYPEYSVPEYSGLYFRLELDASNGCPE